MQNPLENPLVPPLDSINFGSIKTADFLPALDRALEQAKKNVAAVKENTADSTFENTLVALENCSEDLDIVAGLYFNLLSAEADEEFHELAAEFSSKLSTFSSDISLDSEIFKRVKALFDQRSSLKLDVEKDRLLEKSYKGFVRNGALLNDTDKEKLREIDQKLAALSPQFSQNGQKATNAFELLITEESQVAGLPESSKESAREAAKEKKKEGWLFTLEAPSFIPFLQYGDYRPAREKIWRAYNGRSLGGEFDNRTLIKDFVQLRAERAKLLGFKTHSHFVLEERMAENPDRVYKFLDRLLEVAKPAALRELQELKDFKKDLEGNDEIQPWDFMYYSEKLKKKKLDFDAEKLRPYFKLDKVVNGAFKVARLLYDLEFIENKEVPVYHPDVRAFEVKNVKDGTTYGLLYCDFFPRLTKKPGAWMTNYMDQGLFKGKIRRPHVSIVCNFTKPTSQKPSLLTLNEVSTLFHEFGHALHSLLSQCTYRSLSGANVFWDFVELPSQIMENWVLEKEALDLFAEHFETGEKISSEIAQKIKDAAKFQAGYGCLRQLSFAFLDLAWHDGKAAGIKSVDDIEEFEKSIMEKTRLLPLVKGANMSCTFSHIFAGGYSSGYYSYKWAEVLDADAFELFAQKGLFDKETADRFRIELLSRGGTEHPMVLYKNFRGREPNPDALLKRDGLL